MTHNELERKRAERWQLRPELAPNDSKEIRAFLKEVGFCYTYHTDNNTIPSLLRTIMGNSYTLSPFINSHNDPFRELVHDTFETYNKRKLFAEVGCFGKHPVIVYRDILLRLYRILGTPLRESTVTLSHRRKRLAKIESAILNIIETKGGATRRDLRIILGYERRANSQKLTKSLDSLYRKLRVIRIRVAASENILWITPKQWDEKLVKEAHSINQKEALEYLILRFLKTTVATSRRTIRNFFKHIVSRGSIDYSLNSLIQRGLIIVDPTLIIDGKRALIAR